MQKGTMAQLGQLVLSKQGRDAETIYVVTKIENEEFVFVCNGASRTVEKPKKKRVKHLILTNQISGEIKVALEQQKSVHDSQIVFAINNYKKARGEQ